MDLEVLQLLVRIDHHRPKLDELDPLTTEPDSLTYVEDWPATCQFDEQGNDEKNREQNDQAQRCHDEVKQAF